MTGFTLEELYKDLESFKSEAQIIEAELNEIADRADANDIRAEAPDLEETKKALKKKLSVLLLKCAISEGIISREENVRKEDT